MLAEREVTGGGYEEAQWASGFRWAATDALTLDLAGGTKIGREGPDWAATAGLTWLFTP